MMTRQHARICLCAWLLALPGWIRAADPTWKAGIAKAVITPAEPMWMAGYGNRDKPAEGKAMDLWIRAVALEADGRRAVIVSSDTLGIPKPIYDAVAERLEKEFGLSRAQFVLGASHTHCGPVLRGALYDAYPITEVHIEQINAYSDWLTKEIVTTIGAALKNLRPARVSRGVGQTDFAVNRRMNREPDVPTLREQNLLLGPVDHSVPVLAVRDPEGKLAAVVFGYACHNTTLDYYLWSGDYAGYAQNALEERHPGVTACFLMGCGADQNPIPRRSVELAKQYGEMLASAVEAALKETTPLTPKLETSHAFVTLKLGSLPSDDELQKLSRGPANYIQRWSARMLRWKQENRPFPQTYAYPIQAWRLGGEQLILTMGGEVVVDYAHRFKAEFGDQTWVFGYCNDVMAYIPSYRVLLEGGYEGQSSMWVYGMPCTQWGDTIEQDIAAAMERLVETLGK
jgi:hypothetical protein